MDTRRAAEDLGRVVADRCQADDAQYGRPDRSPLPVLVELDGPPLTGDQLVDVVAGRPGDRLFLVGGAGTGKTTLVRGLVCALLDRRAPNDPVPVFLPVSSWQPVRQTLRDWVVAHLGGDSIDGLSDLVRTGRLYFVLDGLGECVVPDPAAVLAALHRDLPDAAGLILSCRSEAYADLRAAGQPPARAVVGTVRSLRAEDVADWLPRDSRWQPVIADLTARPDGPVAQTLSTPEMATLARSVYARSGHPGELVSRPTRADVVRCLTDRLLPALDVPDAARDRLAFLARHLHRSGTRDLAWWRLAATVPEAVRGLVVQFGAGLLLAWALWLVSGAAGLFWFGLGFGVTFGLQGWPADGRGGAIAWRATVATMFTMLIADVYRPVAGVAVGIAIAGLFWVGYGRRAGFIVGLTALGAVVLVARLPGELVWAMVLGGFFAFTTGLAFWAVFREARHRPARIGRRRRGRARSFLRYAAGGLGASFSATVIIALVGWAGVAFALALGLACGLAAGASVWLDAPGRTYQAEPSALLRQDRAAALAGGLVTGALIGLGGWLAAALFVRFSQVRAFDVADAGVVSVVAGLAAGVATALSRSWGGLVLARIWFVLSGRLPPTVMAFLADMHARGVLVRLGGVYRFRFASHQDRLGSP